MLVLSRKVQGSVRIGDQIRITVMKLERGGVRLGIEAPRGVSILRAELCPRDVLAEQHATRENLSVSAS